MVKAAASVSRKSLRTRPLRPRPRREAEEFGPGKADFIVCRRCGAVMENKRWMASFARIRNARETKRIAFAECPACAMIRSRKFEGEVIVRGIPIPRLPEVLARLRHVGERARLRDPMDRLIAVRRQGRGLVVTTTENQLALRVGREMKRLLGGTLRIRWSHEEDVVRIVLEL